MVWPRRTQEHAGGNHRQAQQGDQCGARRSDNEGEDCRSGRLANADDTRRIRQVHRRRNREVGQGDPWRPTSRRSDLRRHGTDLYRPRSIHHETSPPNFCIWQRALPRCRLPRASHSAQTYPSRPVHLIVGFAGRRRDATSLRAYGPMAVGAARPAIRHREPAGRRRQHRHRSGRAGRRRTATRSSWSRRRMRSTRRSTTISISISSATSRRSRALSACPSSWWSIHRFRPRPFPSSSPMPRPIRARSTWRRAGNGTRHMSPASCSR